MSPKALRRSEIALRTEFTGARLACDWAGAYSSDREDLILLFAECNAMGNVVSFPNNLSDLTKDDACWTRFVARSQHN